VLALRLGDPGGALPHAAPPLVHVHVECLLGDALGCRRCDCGERLRAALDDIAAAGRGLLLYQRIDEGAGLLDQLVGYAAADAAAGAGAGDGAAAGPGHPAPRWEAVADALHVLGLHRVRLVDLGSADDGRPDRAARAALARLGIELAPANGEPPAG
jgi:GTP cyclohydrolase II